MAASLFCALVFFVDDLLASIGVKSKGLQDMMTHQQKGDIAKEIKKFVVIF